MCLALSLASTSLAHGGVVAVGGVYHGSVTDEGIHSFVSGEFQITDTVGVHAIWHPNAHRGLTVGTNLGTDRGLYAEARLVDGGVYWWAVGLYFDARVTDRFSVRTIMGIVNLVDYGVFPQALATFEYALDGRLAVVGQLYEGNLSVGLGYHF